MSKLQNIDYKSGYNKYPVYYCAVCHSLDIKINCHTENNDWDGCYCAKCGSTDIKKSSIQQWLLDEKRLHLHDEDF